MRIDQIKVHNFKGFDDREFSLHPEFNLIVGVNGSGKTTLLEALAIAAGSWLLGIPGSEVRHIRTDDVRLVAFDHGDERRWEPQYPCRVEAAGMIDGGLMSWYRSLERPRGRTTTSGSRAVRESAGRAATVSAAGEQVLLPLISYYGTGRLWSTPRDQERVRSDRELVESRPSRLDGYRTSLDPRISSKDLVRWFGRQSWVSFQRNGRSTDTFGAVQQGLIRNIQDATAISFDAAYGEVVVAFASRPAQPFSNLSDGQRSMLALVGDIAQKAVTLNPHLGEDALALTPGVVLIDELDLHLHPTWQRSVVENLRTTFPRIQFIATSHAPFIIQSLRSGDELLMLDGQPTANVGDLSIEQIAVGLQGVSATGVSDRYLEMRDVAKGYLRTLEDAKGAPEEQLAAYRRRLSEQIAPYADNPAFQAFLELKRATALGE